MDKSLEKSLTQWLKSQQFSCGIFLKLSILCGFLNGIAIVGQAYCIARILQQVIMQNMPLQASSSEFVGLVLLLLVRAALAQVRERVSFEAGKRLRSDIRQAVLNKLVELGPVFIKGKPSGAWASLVFEQVEDLHDYYAKYVPQMMLAGFIPLLILVCVFPLNWAAGIILLATAPLIPMFMILVGMGAADASRKNVTALARLSGHFMDRLKGLQTVKLFHRGAAELSNIETASEDFRSRTMSVLRLAFLSSAVLEFFAAVSIAVLAVYFGFSYLDHLDFGHYGVGISLFTGMFVLILAPEFFQPLRDLGTHYHAKAQAVGAAETLVELLNFHVERHDTADSCQAKTLFSADSISIDAIDLEVFSVDGQRLIGPISFTLPAGQHWAIVGPSGAGKTSLLNALLGFLPYKGQLMVNQQPLSNLQLADWRRHLAWLGQDPQLFYGTVRDNVALANPLLTDSQIMTLLEKANISDFVTQHAQGLDLMISDQSAGVSVGQAQRFALARALAQPAKLFLLDEPTASLDAQSEQSVLASLQAAMQGASGLTVTHRLDDLNTMDKVLVMDKGLIVQQGHLSELQHQDGLLAQMINQQQEV
ncbi:cysteine/glutathione ABC transporter permease/ATP-binding protein CydD [Shewanella inventionis]|uniref:Thiol reductant ABC exporter subunit CydD n=1 Tax=Shewanella inventionis TaxID=1738770 RepID=A0ABQ1J123_9GAMM|nr:cysteine/glutathione ABC transporter permease/ATP-binding protein CydD [Shewanella inventionis]MCL1158971.1 cysteine/glutathione ABC transporter permease/ATP-binding protein CydD [Shewanella inventionis]UAL43058.1 cysteine/glutathione ABC transporter permease/ATP-binding protein CydD [Shewanella inventionis]GGB57121.1 thiol reductant ABC exporter subunit CydD [Shewanella inventionis]